MAESIQVNVKWGREKLTVECNPSESPDVFRAQLFGVTEVLPERQKLMFKGKTIQSEWPKTIKFKPNMTFLLMGTAEKGITQEGAEKIVFEEDLKDSEKIGASALPPGLPNLGNTCYLNASVQCMGKVPELADALVEYSQRNLGASLGPGCEMVKALSSVFTNMKIAKDSVVLGRAIEQMWSWLRTTNAQFNEQQPPGVFAQQDAAEAWQTIMNTIREFVPAPGNPSPPPRGQSIVDQLFGLRLRVSLNNSENPDEPPSISDEGELSLSCAISKDVKHLTSGIQVGLSGEITKQSETLGREAVYSKRTEITRLPGYVVIQFVRFEFKRAKGEQCKIIKDVKFPKDLDLIEFCTPELRDKLKPMRDAFEEHRNAVIDSEVTFQKSEPATEEAAASADSATAVATSKEYESYSFSDDPGSNNSGYYELESVLTHTGQTTSSGHYIGWGKLEGDNWAIFDDDAVTPIKSEKIMALSGANGARSPIAYLLVYSSKRLPKGNYDSLKSAMQVEGSSSDVAATANADTSSAPMEEA